MEKRRKNAEILDRSIAFFYDISNQHGNTGTRLK